MQARRTAHSCATSHRSRTTIAPSTGGRGGDRRPRGRRIVDTQPDVPGGELSRSRPEIATALRGRRVSGMRHSRHARHGAALRGRAGRVGRRRARRGAHHVPDLDARRARRPLLAAPRSASRSIVLAAAALVGAAARALRHATAARPRTGRGRGRRRRPRRARARARRAARGPVARPRLNETAAKLASARSRSQERVRRRRIAPAAHAAHRAAASTRERRRRTAACARSDRLGRLVDGLLALARAERRPAPATTSTCRDRQRAASSTWEPLAAEHDVALVGDTATARVVHARRRARRAGARQPALERVRASPARTPSRSTVAATPGSRCTSSTRARA